MSRREIFCWQRFAFRLPPWLKSCFFWCTFCDPFLPALLVDALFRPVSPRPIVRVPTVSVRREARRKSHTTTTHFSCVWCMFVCCLVHKIRPFFLGHQEKEVCLSPRRFLHLLHFRSYICIQPTSLDDSRDSTSLCCLSPNSLRFTHILHTV